ncbi:MAG: LysR family transcriptional regulator [Spongiibacteraceae bacterium]
MKALFKKSERVARNGRTAMIQHPLTLDAVRVVETIARRGSFAAAADELHRVTSAVSYTVQKLEEDLGVSLFDRSGHRAKLTAAGQLLVARGRELLGASSQLAGDVRAVASGWEPQLTIALDLVYPEELLIPLIARFYEEHENTGRSAGDGETGVNAITDIRISGEILGGAWDALESGRADLAIAPGFAPLPGFHTRPLDHVPFVLVAAPGHPIFAETEPLAVRENYRAIAVADTSRQRAPRSVRLGKRQSTLTVSSFAAKIAALEAGLGIGSLPEPLARAPLVAGTLRALDATPDYAEVVLAWPQQPQGRAGQWFLNALPDYFRTLSEQCGHAPPP